MACDYLYIQLGFTHTHTEVSPVIEMQLFVFFNLCAQKLYVTFFSFLGINSILAFNGTMQRQWAGGGGGGRLRQREGERRGRLGMAS